jgi:23S rRNA G2445 N2-methylase RlmL
MVYNYMNPFSDDRKRLEFTCVEINPAYIEVGKKIMPNARWIQADILDLPEGIGHFDCAFGNPPFGTQVGSKQSSPRLASGPFEYKVIDVASDIADDGVFVVPQSSAPFQLSGRQSITFDKSRAYQKFEEDTRIVLDPNCGIDCTVEAKWRGVHIVTEIVLADFKAARERRNPVVEQVDEDEPSLILV